MSKLSHVSSSPRLGFGRDLPGLRRLCASLVAGLVACVGLAQSASADPLMIDSFASPGTAEFYICNTSTAMAKSDTGSGIIGGQRDILTHVIGAAQPNSMVGLIGYDSSPGYQYDALQIGTNGKSPTQMTLMYSGTHSFDSSATSLTNAHALGGLDLTAGGANNEFMFHFINVDAQPTTGLKVDITITSPGGGTSTVSGIAPNSTMAYNFPISFGSLTGTASVSNVDSIQVMFNSANTPNVDYVLNSISTVSLVPEPATGAMLVAGCLAVGCVTIAKRRRAASCLQIA